MKGECPRERDLWIPTLARRATRKDGARSFFIMAAPLLALGLGLSLPRLQAQDTVLHVEVKLVSVFVNVTDRNGAIVGGLTKDDFHVAEDGRQQEIAAQAVGIFPHQFLRHVLV